MNDIFKQPLSERVLELQPAFFNALTRYGTHDLEIDHQAEDWISVLQEVHNASKFRTLDPSTSSIALAVANNLRSVSSAAIAIQQANTHSIEALIDAVSGIMLAPAVTEKRPSESTPFRSSKRARQSSPSKPPTRSSSPTPSLPDDLATSSLLSAHSKKPPKNKTQEPDHSLIRLWFLENLSYPYPTVSVKETLAVSAGITRAKVDSDLTNFRRRAGWTEIMNEYCGGDREKMRRLIQRVEGGEEDDEELVHRIEGVKEYLTRKEEERVGDWVREVTALVPSFNFDITSTSSTTTTTTTSKVSKHRSNASLSSLSAMSSVSAVVRPGSRSTSTSSTTSLETSSSVSDASMVIPGTKGNKKRLNPNAAVFVPQKRTALSNGDLGTATFDEAYASTSAPNYAPGSALAPSLTFTAITADQSTAHSRSASGSSATWQYQPTWNNSDSSSADASPYTFVHPGTPAPLPTPLLQSRSSPPQAARTSQDQSIWSTEAPLPMLSHMSSASSSTIAQMPVQQHASWMMPSECGFEPQLQDGRASASSSAFDGGRSVSGGSERSVSDINRRL
ncbi:hypothetical protein IAT40_004166 [Kwoniella sp. CBS 6097]